MVLTPKGYMHRYADDEVEKYLKVFGAVNVKGPRDCGKTWTSLNHANSIVALDDPERNFHNLRMAQTHPAEIIRGEEPRLVDEWQMSPGVWNAVRHRVDEGKDKGRVILCGSATPNEEMRNLLHTGFGRIGTCRMRTMSLYESGDSDGDVSLFSLFNSQPLETGWKSTDLEGIIKLIIRGGWPRTIGMNVDNAVVYNRNLLTSIEEEQIFRLDPTADIRTIRMMLKSLARNESTVATDKRIRSDIRIGSEDPMIAQSTFVKYLGYLERLYLVEDQPAFNPNLKASVRVGKSVKRHLVDPSLAVAALGVDAERLWDDHPTLGLLFEAMCERDLRIYAGTKEGNLFHYRDGDGREIDAVVELPDGRWGAFEIKLTTSGIDEGAKNLLKISSYIEKQEGSRPPSFLCVICGTSEYAELRDDGVYVVPITRLRARR